MEKTNKKYNNVTTLVVFDGTSYFPIPHFDFDEEEHEIVLETDNFDYAVKFADSKNETC